MPSNICDRLEEIRNRNLNVSKLILGSNTKELTNEEIINYIRSISTDLALLSYAIKMKIDPFR